MNLCYYNTDWQYFLSQPLPLTHCRCRGLLLHLIALSDAHSVGVLWTTDQPDPETSS